MLARNLRFFAPLSRAFSTAQFSAKMVADLRKQSGASIGLCREALVAESGNVEAALAWLRKKGVDTSAKRGARDASNGVIAIHQTPEFLSIVELNCETDFVARNESFVNLAKTFASALPADAPLAPSTEVLDSLFASKTTDASATMGEKVVAKRAARVPLTPAESTAVGIYQHQVANGASQKLSVVTLSLSPETPRAQADAFAALLAMQAVSSMPKYLDQLPAEVIATETAIASEQAAAKFDGKVDSVGAKKFIEGMLSKTRRAECFLAQDWFMQELCEQNQLPAIAAKDVQGAVDGFNAQVPGAKVQIKNVVVMAIGAPTALVH